MLLCGMAALILIVEQLLLQTGLIERPEQRYTDGSIQILCIIAMILFVDRFTNRFIDQHSEKTKAFRNSRTILQGTARTLMFVIGALVLMGTLGISITPIIASLGITSLAVALALQPTLENFFSGVQLVMDKPIRVGDFIELESGEQGFVDKIGWRSTWIRMLPNNTVIMPNSALSKSKIINYFYPEKELSVPVEVSVTPSDPGQPTGSPWRDPNSSQAAKRSTNQHWRTTVLTVGSPYRAHSRCLLNT